MKAWQPREGRVWEEQALQSNRALCKGLGPRQKGRHKIRHSATGFEQGQRPRPKGDSGALRLPKVGGCNIKYKLSQTDGG